MTSFIYKQIRTQKSVAERLKEKRLNLNLSIEKISQLINISTKYLSALENGEYDKIPGEIYLKQWLKKYALLLELDPQELLRNYQKETKLQLNFSDYQGKTIFKPKKVLFYFTPKTFRNLIVGLIIFIFLFYLGWEVKKIIEPPILQIKEPKNFTVTTNNKIIIKGQSEPEVSLWINNQLVLASPYGDFQKEVELLPGLNTFQISAKKKYSQKNTIILSIIKTNDSSVNNKENKSSLSLINKIGSILT